MNDIEWILDKLEKWIEDNKKEYGNAFESPYMTWYIIDYDDIKHKIEELKETNR